MSRGISIYYKLLNQDDSKYTFGYSGTDLNKGYDEKSLLRYDGVIEIDKAASLSVSITEALTNNKVRVLKDCENEWHCNRLSHGEQTIGLFALNVISKILREFEERGSVPEKGGVAY